MRFTRIRLVNWKNFTDADVALAERMFLIGPNASGKSNLLDAFRFLRDLVVSGGGLQKACEERGGISKLRSLSARKPSTVTIDVELEDEEQARWSYLVEFGGYSRFQSPTGVRLRREIVKRNDDVLLNRPNSQDDTDAERLSQTAIEQIAANQSFRPLANHFAETFYLHLVPQLIRQSAGSSRDPSLEMYGGRFLERMAAVNQNTRRARLKRIQSVLQSVVPQFQRLELIQDKYGKYHLEVVYDHWRLAGAKQNEQQFSDGTLRLIGLLWALQEKSGLLLMEEPELSLHSAIVRQFASFVFRVQTSGQTQRQVFISTHSADLLSDEGIGAEEVLIFEPTSSGTQIKTGLQVPEIADFMQQGFTAAEIALPHTRPDNVNQLPLFDL